MKPIKIRNIGIYAHVDSGKSTLLERILFEAKEISSVGKIEEGTTESDRMKSEIERGISIFSTCLQIPYKVKSQIVKFNFIDTPGHLDFFTQVRESFSAIDIAILLIDINAGFRSQTERIYEELRERNIPIILFINKIDKNANVEEFLIDIAEFFSVRLLPVFKMEEVPKYIFDSKEIDEELELDYIEWDNSLTEKYLGKPSKKILQTGLMEGFLQLGHIPCFAGSALTGLGVKPLLDFLALVNFESSKDEFSGKFIKRITHLDLGKIYLVKSYSELAIRKEYFLNSKKIIFEKFYEISVNEIFSSDFISANSVFYAKVKNPSSKDLDSANVEYNKNPEKLLSTKFSDNRKLVPLVETYSTSEYFLLLEPESPDLREKLIWGLEELVWEDQGLEYTEKDTTQLELRGSGELHLEVAISRLKEFIGEIFQISLFQVAKYELWKKMTLKVSFEHSAYENKLKSGTLNCVLESSSDLSNKVFWDFKLDEDLKSSVESAVNEIVSNGNQGFLVQGLQIRFLSYLPEQEKNDSTPSLLKVATISGIKSALKNNTVFIGPKVHFEIIIPEAYYGSVLAVLNRRSAKIIKVDVAKGNKSLLKGEASAQKMLGFQSALRNMTQGRGFYSSRVFFDKDTYFEF